MIKYELEINLKVIVDGKEVEDTYIESGEGPVDNLEEGLKMFVKPRIEAGGFILARRIGKKF